MNYIRVVSKLTAPHSINCRRFLSAFIYSRQAPLIVMSIRPSVRPSACGIGAPNGRISVKLDTDDFIKICRENANLVKIWHLTRRPN